MEFDILSIDSEDNSYSFQTIIKEILYNIELVWNTRGQFWVIKLSNSKDDIIAISKVCTDYPLFFRYSNPEQPQTNFWTVDLTQKGLEPLRDNLGIDIIIVSES